MHTANKRALELLDADFVAYAKTEAGLVLS